MYLVPYFTTMKERLSCPPKTSAMRRLSGSLKHDMDVQSHLLELNLLLLALAIGIQDAVS